MCSIRQQNLVLQQENHCHHGEVDMGAGCMMQRKATQGICRKQIARQECRQEQCHGKTLTLIYLLVVLMVGTCGKGGRRGKQQDPRFQTSVYVVSIQWQSESDFDVISDQGGYRYYSHRVKSEELMGKKHRRLTETNDRITAYTGCPEVGGLHKWKQNWMLSDNCSINNG